MDFSLHKIVEQKLKNKKLIDKKNIIQSKEKGEERVENTKKVASETQKSEKRGWAQMWQESIIFE